MPVIGIYPLQRLSLFGGKIMLNGLFPIRKAIALMQSYHIRSPIRLQKHVIKVPPLEKIFHRRRFDYPGRYAGVTAFSSVCARIPFCTLSIPCPLPSLKTIREWAQGTMCSAKTVKSTRAQTRGNLDCFHSISRSEVPFGTCVRPSRNKNRRTDQETTNLNNANFTDAALLCCAR